MLTGRPDLALSPTPTAWVCVQRPANSQEHPPCEPEGVQQAAAAMAGALTKHISKALGKASFRDAWKAGGWKVLIDGNLA